MSKRNDELWNQQTELDQQKFKDWAQAQTFQDLQKQFTGAFNKGYGQQQDVLGQIQPYVQSTLSGIQGLTGAANQLPLGLSPESMAALQGQALDRTPAAYDQAQQAIKAQLGGRGLYGGQGGFGNVAGMFSGLQSAKAQDIASQLRNITLTNEQLRNQNLQANRQFNLGALASIPGVSGQFASIFNPAEYMQGAIAAGQGANQSLGLANQMAGARANPNLIRKSWWDTYGGPLVGAGVNLATGGWGGLFGGGSGGDYSSVQTPNMDLGWG